MVSLTDVARALRRRHFALRDDWRITIRQRFMFPLLAPRPDGRQPEAIYYIRGLRLPVD